MLSNMSLIICLDIISKNYISRAHGYTTLYVLYKEELNSALIEVSYFVVILFQIVASYIS
jgi:hypothetical protein